MQKLIVAFLFVTVLITAEQNSAWYTTINSKIWTKESEKSLNAERFYVYNRLLQAFCKHSSFGGVLANKIEVRRLMKRAKKKCDLKKYRVFAPQKTYRYIADNKKVLRSKKCIECMQSILAYVECADLYYKNLHSPMRHESDTVDTDSYADSENVSSHS